MTTYTVVVEYEFELEATNLEEATDLSDKMFNAIVLHPHTEERIDPATYIRAIKGE